MMKWFHEIFWLEFYNKNSWLVETETEFILKDTFDYFNTVPYSNPMEKLQTP